MYEVSLTTISRIKHKVNHNKTIDEYYALPKEQRREIYDTFCESLDFYNKKVKQTILKSKRKLNKQQVFMILYNFEKQIVTRAKMAEIVGVNSTYTLDCIKNGTTYKDYYLEYQSLTNDEKEKLVSLFGNE